MAGTEIIPVVPGPLQMNCPGCSTTLTVTGHAQAVCVACEECGAVTGLLSGKNELLLRFDKLMKTRLKPLIPIGSQGRLRGRTFRVLSFAQYRESVKYGGSYYYWREYLLFNPTFGYAFLSEYDGHWNFIFETNDYPRDIGYNAFYHHNRAYRLYNKYKPVTDYAVGEFCWNIKETSRFKVQEYIAPPYVFIRQLSEDRMNWLHGEYITAAEIAEAFGIKDRLPEPTGVGATEPYMKGSNFESIRKVSIFLAVLLLILQITFSSLSREQVIYKESFTNVGYPPKMIVTPPFHVPLSKSNLEFSIFSPVDNSWVETEVALINNKTGEEFAFTEAVELYRGYEDGSTWTEGSTYENRVISSVPEGTYHLEILPYYGGSGNTTFTVEIKRDVPMWSNFFVTLLLLAIYPLIYWYRMRSFEKKRWMNSSYTPYNE
jgi:hypothetical protein